MIVHTETKIYFISQKERSLSNLTKRDDSSYKFEVLCSVAYGINNGKIKAFIQTPLGDSQIHRVFPNGLVEHDYGKCFLHPYTEVKVVR